MDTIFCEFHTIINPWGLRNRNFTFKLLWFYDWNKVSQSLVIHQSHLQEKLWELCWFYAPFWPFVKHGDWRWSILRKFPCTLNKILLLNSNKKTVRQAFRLFSDKNNEPPKKGAKKGQKLNYLPKFIKNWSCLIFIRWPVLFWGKEWSRNKCSKTK